MPNWLLGRHDANLPCVARPAAASRGGNQVRKSFPLEHKAKGDTATSRVEISQGKPGTPYKDKFIHCLDANCRYIEKTPKICGDFGLCTISCSMNCCCLFQVTYKFILRVSKGLRDALVRAMVMLMAMQQGMANSREGLPEPKNKEKLDPGEAIKYTTDVVMDIMKLWTGVPAAFLVLALVHERVKGMILLFWKVKIKKEGDIRTDDLTPAQRAKYEADQSAKEQAMLKELVSEAEQDRLGGIEDHVITK
ncbi:unnamed protein product, partial [Prorocentrum cordatum]